MESHPKQGRLDEHSASWENNYPNPPLHWGTAIYHDDNFPGPGYASPPGNGVMMAEGLLVASYNSLNQPVAMIPTGWSDAIFFGYDPLGRYMRQPSQAWCQRTG